MGGKLGGAWIEVYRTETEGKIIVMVMVKELEHTEQVMHNALADYSRFISMGEGYWWCYSFSTLKKYKKNKVWD